MLPQMDDDAINEIEDPSHYSIVQIRELTQLDTRKSTMAQRELIVFLLLAAFLRRKLCCLAQYALGSLSNFSNSVAHCLNGFN